MNSRKIWSLPWKGSEVPHAVLDLNRECNVRCEACYANSHRWEKTFDDINHELIQLLRLRRLQSVTILGGESLLHKDLYRTIRAIKDRGLGVTVFTNGLLLDAAIAHRLRESGADLVCVHIDRHQQRSDVSRPEDISRLRQEKLAMLHSAGLEAGLAVTAYPGHFEEVIEASKFVLDSPAASYLIVTLFRDSGKFETVSGNLIEGLHHQGKPNLRGSDQWNMESIAAEMQNVLGLRPFACVPSNRSAADIRWLSYAVAVTDSAHFMFEAGTAETVLLRVLRFLRGRYPFYEKQSAAATRLYVLYHSVANRKIRSALHFVRRSFAGRKTVSLKRILFQNPADLLPDGSIIYCDPCPDATIRNGRLVPVCLADIVDNYGATNESSSLTILAH